jgi:deoxyribodipyrimidine photo-lyase
VPVRSLLPTPTKD